MKRIVIDGGIELLAGAVFLLCVMSFVVVAPWSIETNTIGFIPDAPESSPDARRVVQSSDRRTTPYTITNQTAHASWPDANLIRVAKEDL